MKFRGGYNVPLAGRPAEEVQTLGEPSSLHLPLAGRRLTFTKIEVADGQRVAPGAVLAVDPANFGVPLLAPRAGTVRLSVPGHVTLEDLAAEGAGWDERSESSLPCSTEARPADNARPNPPPLDHAGDREPLPTDKRERLLRLGAWALFHDAHTRRVADPARTPSAVIVSTIRLEPFLARGSVQLKTRLDDFTRGLEQIQSMLEYEAIYLVLPDIRGEFARFVRQTLRGLAWVDLVQAPLRYPFDDFALLARALGLKRDPDRPVWGLTTEGVLAADRALTDGRAATERIVAVGGPAVTDPIHVRAMTGYPLDELSAGRLVAGPNRVILGGCLTGAASEQCTLGLPADCTGLTIIPEQTQREFLTFLRPGFARPSYSKCYIASARRGLLEAMTTSRRGDERACISCVLCERVCPVRLMPHLIHKHLYADRLEQAERAGVGLCIGCGLCSYVCPSKIELREQIDLAKARIAEDLHGAEPPLSDGGYSQPPPPGGGYEEAAR